MENDTIQALKRIIEKHTVLYDVSPHYEIAGGKRIMVGLDLELHGTHDQGHTRLTPGCNLCQETYEDLRRLAEWILPKEQRPSRYDIPPFDASLHGSRSGEFEVVLPIRIEHRQGFFEPIDACEERCLKEVQEKLAELGVTTGHGARLQ